VDSPVSASSSDVVSSERKDGPASRPDWDVDKVRDTFVEFFEGKEHSAVPSSPVVPLNDPTILFANAGMNQFKSIFLGQVDPKSTLASLRRAANSQKCIRAGGKHNDLEDVGKDTYHHTFFEMLGSWSFGDYFKEEAITWAWELLTDVYKLPKDRLYASYFGGDEAMGLEADTEARDLWLRYLPPEQVLPFGKKENLWEMGDQGPCGPCSEVHFDRIGGRDASALVNADDPNVIEIWNLVFMQYNREASGNLRQLPNKHVDTGMGLERMVSVLQGQSSNYDTDVFSSLLKRVQEVTGAPAYTGVVAGDESADEKALLKDVAYRVIVDHLRTLTFAIADGAYPSNEGRGYVLRRILRRAVRYGQQILGAKKGFFSELIPFVVEQFGGAYPEIKSQKDHVIEVIQDEEKAFSSMLDRGVKYFSDLEGKLTTSKATVVPGNEAFYLYDTLGFPLDLTQLMAEERGFTVDTKGFESEMEKQKNRAREALQKQKAGALQGNPVVFQAEEVDWLQKSGIEATNDDAKYQWDVKVEADVKAIFNPETKTFEDSYTGPEDVAFGIVLDQSPFYAEAGGQIGDTGALKLGDGSRFNVLDVQTFGGYVVHIGVMESKSTNTPRVGAKVTCMVDYDRRRDVAPNHTMTHVLNFALRRALGENVDQRGSLVDQEKLRFDFSFNKALKAEQLTEVEDTVKRIIEQRLPVKSKVIPLKEAQAISSLRAVFGEAYPDPVRVVSVGADVEEMRGAPEETKWKDYSVELCGGTHISNTAQAGSFVIVEESAIAKGVRRIVALTRNAAYAAETLGNQLEESVRTLEGLSLGEAGKLTASIREQIDSAEISASLKSRLRDRIASVGKKVMEEKKKELAKLVDVRIKDALDAAEKVASNGETILVHSVSLGLDAKLLNKVVNAVFKAHPELSFMAVSEEEPGSGGPVLCVSNLPPSAVDAGMKAAEWNAAALEKWGGKGGGKPNSAQARAATCDNVEELMSTARQYAADKLPS